MRKAIGAIVATSIAAVARSQDIAKIQEGLRRAAATVQGMSFQLDLHVLRNAPHPSENLIVLARSGEKINVTEYDGKEARHGTERSFFVWSGEYGRKMYMPGQTSGGLRYFTASDPFLKRGPDLLDPCFVTGLGQLGQDGVIAGAIGSGHFTAAYRPDGSVVLTGNREDGGKQTYVVDTKAQFLVTECVESRSYPKQNYTKTAKVLSTQPFNGVPVPTDVMCSVKVTRLRAGVSTSSTSTTELKVTNLVGKVDPSLFKIFNEGETVLVNGSSYKVLANDRLQKVPSEAPRRVRDLRFLTVFGAALVLGFGYWRFHRVNGKR